MTTVSRVKTKNNKIENFSLAIFFFDNERITVTVCFAHTSVVVVVVVVEPETFQFLVQVTIELLSHWAIVGTRPLNYIG